MEIRTFRKFNSIDVAKQMGKTLNQHGIEYQITDNSPSLDRTITGTTLLQEYEIKINVTDFKKAESILEDENKVAIEEVPSDYYLLEFSNNELLEIFIKPDEWGEFDKNLAKELLKSRGKEITTSEIKLLKEKRLQDLKKTEPVKQLWIYIGYLFSVLGGFLGIIIGYSIYSAKKTLPNGERIYIHSEKDRKRAKTLMQFSIVFFIAYTCIKLNSMYR